MLIRLLLGFALAYLLSLVAVPTARRAALRFGIVDAPDGRLKRQRAPVPYFGGLAVLVSFLLSLGMTWPLPAEMIRRFVSGIDGRVVVLGDGQ